jgi:hypothetical protein
VNAFVDDDGPLARCRPVVRTRESEVVIIVIVSVRPIAFLTGMV